MGWRVRGLLSHPDPLRQARQPPLAAVLPANSSQPYSSLEQCLESSHLEMPELLLHIVTDPLTLWGDQCLAYPGYNVPTLFLQSATSLNPSIYFLEMALSLLRTPATLGSVDNTFALSRGLSVTLTCVSD